MYQVHSRSSSFLLELSFFEATESLHGDSEHKGSIYYSSLGIRKHHLKAYLEYNTNGSPHGVGGYIRGILLS
jgi:hypothetical protein